ncbi:hypothetical protein BH24ACT5_BH24ACT5_20590 [soil metagenome]
MGRPGLEPGTLGLDVGSLSETSGALPAFEDARGSRSGARVATRVDVARCDRRTMALSAVSLWTDSSYHSIVTKVAGQCTTSVFRSPLADVELVAFGVGHRDPVDLAEAAGAQSSCSEGDEA